MNGKDSDEKIKKITMLLEKGGTMLATHHECGAPMFRFQGKIVCPVCDMQEEKPPEEKHTAKAADPYSINISNIIMNKIKSIAGSLETEADLGRIKDKMECIEQGIKILKLLEKS